MYIYEELNVHWSFNICTSITIQPNTKTIPTLIAGYVYT